MGHNSVTDVYFQITFVIFQNESHSFEMQKCREEIHMLKNDNGQAHHKYNKLNEEFNQLMRTLRAMVCLQTNFE